MPATITFTPVPNDRVLAASRLNELFQAVATVLNNKLDRRGDTVAADIQLADGSVINVPPSVEVGDPASAGELINV